MLEGEMNYDFEQAFAEGFTNPSNPSSVTFVPSNLRVLHGLFGPKIVAGHGAIRPFLTLKGGFINFRLDARNPSLSTFVRSVDNLRGNKVSGNAYSGRGLEGHIDRLE